MKGREILRVALSVTLGWFVMGFDATVISGAVPFLKRYFQLLDQDGDWKLGLAVSCLGWGAVAGNAIAGFLGDFFGRTKVLKFYSVLFILSALMSALTTSFVVFVVSRVLGGVAVGGVILVVPMYVSEISPAPIRGRMVSCGQLMVVTGISAAFFSNYFLLQAGENCWRWMLGVEAIPSALYLCLLFCVPESPRWLYFKGREEEARAVLTQVGGEPYALEEMARMHDSPRAQPNEGGCTALPRVRKDILVIALTIAFFQQITGINAVLYYLPTIFSQAGGETSSAFEQAVVVGVVNLVMTLVAMKWIDGLGRKPLLLFGTLGMTLSLLACTVAFYNATYQLTSSSVSNLRSFQVNEDVVLALNKPQENLRFRTEEEYLAYLRSVLGASQVAQFQEALVNAGRVMNTKVVLCGILGYVAAFAVSLGPVMWVLLSEIFPNSCRGAGMSVVGFWNSIVSASVTLVFPWELSHLHAAGTFFFYALFSFLALLFVTFFVPETKGRTLEELEEILPVLEHRASPTR